MHFPQIQIPKTLRRTARTRDVDYRMEAQHVFLAGMENLKAETRVDPLLHNKAVPLPWGCQSSLKKVLFDAHELVVERVLLCYRSSTVM